MQIFAFAKTDFLGVKNDHFPEIFDYLGKIEI